MFAGDVARITRATANLARFHGVAGVITQIDIWTDFPASIGNNTFTMKVNGVDQFPATIDKPVILSTESTVQKTGLAIPIVDGDVISFDLVTVGAAGLTAPIYCQITIDTVKTVNKTTASLADQATENGTVTLATEFVLNKIVADRYCRIRLYKTAAARTADASRAFGNTSYIGTQHKMILDLLLNAITGLTWALAPEAIGSNGDTPKTSVIYYAIENLSGSAHTVSVDFTISKGV